MVGLEVFPEELAEQVGEVLQRGEVERTLAFSEIVDEHVAHRGAGNIVAVDELRTARPATSREHPERPRRVLPEGAALTQCLVEERASGVPLSVATHLAGELQELHAVADGHVT